MVGFLALLPGTSAADTTQYTLLPSMPSSVHKGLQDEEEQMDGIQVDVTSSGLHAHPDAEFGGEEARKRLEKQLLWKLDLRMSILIVIYVLNYVRACQSVVYLPALTYFADRPK